MSTEFYDRVNSIDWDLAKNIVLNTYIVVYTSSIIGNLIALIRNVNSHHWLS
jgi:hypothetical protein